MGPSKTRRSSCLSFMSFYHYDLGVPTLNPEGPLLYYPREGKENAMDSEKMRAFLREKRKRVEEVATMRTEKVV